MPDQIIKNEGLHNALGGADLLFSSRIIKFILLIQDVVSFFLASIFAYGICILFNNYSFDVWFDGQDIDRYYSWIVMVVLSLLIFSLKYRHYSVRNSYWMELGEILGALFIIFMLDWTLIAIFRWNSSRLWGLCVWFLSAIYIPFGRFLIRKLLTSIKRWHMPCIIFGCESNAIEAYRALSSEWWQGFNVVGFICENGIANSKLELDGDIINIYPIEIIDSNVNLSSVHVVIAADGELINIGNYIRLFEMRGARDICVVPSLKGMPLYGAKISYFLKRELLMVGLSNKIEKTFPLFFKRIFDIVCSLMIFMLLSPILIGIVMRLLYDGHGVLYAHERVGLDGKKFNCFKFKSMYENAPQLLEDWFVRSPKSREEWLNNFKLKYDPRITRFGSYLRVTSLDELPQLWNVLVGDMSLVGPRPVTVDELVRYGDDRFYYTMVKPGITGLWQVSGRNNLSYAQRVYFDVWYVKNWSVWLDIVILFKTIGVVLKKQGAY